MTGDRDDKQFLPLPIYQDGEAYGSEYDQVQDDEDIPGFAVSSYHLALTADDLTLNEKLEGLPKNPGIYQFKNAAGRVIYVGKAKHLRNRVRSYFHRYQTTGDAKLRALVTKIADVELLLTDTDVEALILENTLIKKFRPRYNVMLRDDKTYPWIVVTNEPYPRVFPTRKKRKDGSKYYGPYTDGLYLRYLFKTLRDIFPLRTCDYYIDDDFIEKKKARVCLEYHIKRCEGPCEGLMPHDAYMDMIKNVKQFLSGRTKDLERELEDEMKSLSEAMLFEDAARARDQLVVLSEYAHKQKVVTSDEADRDIFAVAAEEDDACGLVFNVRDGKLVGKRHFYFTGAEGKTQAEILDPLLEQYYSNVDYIPEEIFLPVELDTADTFEAWLAERVRQLSAEGNGEAMKPPQLIVPKIGDKAKVVSMAATNAKFLLGEVRMQKLKQKEHISHSVTALQRDLRLKNPPKHIECFDNSHLMGSEPVSSMVYFENGKPKKSEYRKFKLCSLGDGVIDDFRAMQEVVGRRYARLIEDKRPLPDLIIVDGGKGQLSHAYDVLTDLGIADIPIIGLAKRLEEVFVIGSPEAVILPKTSSSLRLLQQMRDEAHRFAITYHRTLRDKRTLQTELTQIRGIGAKTAEKLLERFGSVEGVRQASEVEIVDAVGLKVARKIKEHFSEQEAVHARDTN